MNKVMNDSEGRAYVKQLFDALKDHGTSYARVARIWPAVMKVHPEYKSYPEAKEIEDFLKKKRLQNSTDPIVANALAWKQGVINNAKVKIVSREGSWWVICPDGKLRGKSDNRDGAVRWAEANGFKDWVVHNYTTSAKACNSSYWEKVYTIKGVPVKLVYRGDPYCDINATIEGGNRDYVQVGRIFMSQPPSQSIAEKLVAPHWSKVKRTAWNASITNAYYITRVSPGKPDAHERFDSKSEAMEKLLSYTHTADERMFAKRFCSFNDGGTKYILRGPTPNAVNAVDNAWSSRYKVGDKIRFEARSAFGSGVVGMKSGYSPSFLSMLTGVITKDLGRGLWQVKSSNGESMKVDEADFYGCLR